MGAAIRKTNVVVAAAAALLAAAGLTAGAAARADELADARAAFERAWKGTDYQAKVAAIERLIETGEGEAIKLVVERALVCDDQFVFERAVDLLRDKTDEDDRLWLCEQAQKHANKDIRVVLTKMMGTLDCPNAVDTIKVALKDREWTVRAAAVRAARERRVKALVGPLIKVVEADDGRVRQDAIDALRDMTGADYGKEAAKWASWWAGAEAGFVLKPPPAQGDAEDEGGAAAGRGVEKKDVDTVAREGLYEIRSKRTLFVFDVSASMEARTAKGTRMEICKKELQRAIKNLGDDMLFNVLFFSDKAQLWKPRMVRAGSNVSSAVRVVESVKADGMTATYDALKLAFTLEDVDTIYFLSDGFPTAGGMTSEELIKTEVRKWNRAKGIAIYTIAFVAGEIKGEREDKERAKGFMKELAAENGGTCKFVE